MKIPCVRCGKKIDSPNVYCKECQKDMGIAIGTPPRSKRRWYTYLIVLLLLAFAGYYFYLDNKEVVSKVSSFVKGVEQSADELKEKVFDQLHIEQSAGLKQEQVAAKSATVQEQPDSISLEQEPAAVAHQEESTVNSDTASQIVEDSSAPAPESTSVDLAPSVEPMAGVPQEAAAEAVAESPAAAAEPVDEISSTIEDSSVSAEEDQETQVVASEENNTDTFSGQVAVPESSSAESAAIAEDNPLLHVGIIIYYLKNKGADVAVQRKLLDAGYTDVVVKGKWPGSFNDQNVFCRSEDQPGVQELLDILGPNWFQYHYMGARISSSVKRIFNRNDHIQFLLIPK